MTKTDKKDEEEGGHQARLAVIASMNLGALDDDQVLTLLAERKRLEGLQAEYERKQQEQTAHLALEKEKEEALARLAELNRLIAPDKADEELLRLIAERQKLEQALAVVEDKIGQAGDALPDQSVPEAPLPLPVAETVSDISVVPEPPAIVPLEPEKPPVSVESAEPEKEEAVERESIVPEALPAMPVPVPSPSPIAKKMDLKDDFGREGIVDEDTEPNSIIVRYLDQLRSSTGSIGTLLDNMPADAKKNKAFMLRVAEIDPAYAMHYADKEVLKKDEDFNVRIAAMKNPRHSGSPLAEMLPEARTPKVLLTAVKQDYRNIRYAHSRMDDYPEMLAIAKRRALERIRALKAAADVNALVPIALRKDAAFMTEVNAIIATVPKGEDEKPAASDAVPAGTTGQAPVKGEWTIRPSGS